MLLATDRNGAHAVHVARDAANVVLECRRASRSTGWTVTAALGVAVMAMAVRTADALLLCAEPIVPHAFPARRRARDAGGWTSPAGSSLPSLRLRVRCGQPEPDGPWLQAGWREIAAVFGWPHVQVVQIA